MSTRDIVLDRIARITKKTFSDFAIECVKEGKPLPVFSVADYTALQAVFKFKNDDLVKKIENLSLEDNEDSYPGTPLEKGTSEYEAKKSILDRELDEMISERLKQK
jgi:hypothetical protein